MKKRIIISFIATGILVASTYKCWLTYKPINLNFHISGSGIYNIKTYLNKKDNNEFKRNKTANEIVNIDSTQDVSLSIKKCKKAKRLKIAFDCADEAQNPQKTLIIKDIELNDKQIEDLENFTSQSASIKPEKDKLVIIPSEKYFEIVYNTPLNIKNKINIDVQALIILCVLSYLLSYKLTSYMADFKNIKNKSRIEILFLSILGILLIIPTSYITDEKYSKKENRKLAEKQSFIKDNEINYNYGKEFDTWFSDRFNLRYIIVTTYHKLRFILTYQLYRQNNTYYYNKKTRWAFNTDWEQHQDSSANFPIYYKKIKTLNDYCEKNHIKLYILLAPTKMYAYPQYYPFNIKYDNNVHFSKYVNRKMGKDIAIYPLEQIITASANGYTFPQGDPHWSEYGAFTGYKVLMKTIKQDFPNLKVLDENDFIISHNKLAKTDFGGTYNKGHEYTVLGIGKRQLKAEYKSYEYKKINQLTINSNQNNLAENSYLPNGYNKKVFLIGNSFSENLFIFLKSTFKSVHKKRFNNPAEIDVLKMSRWENEIENYKPDILIICLTSIRSFAQLYGDEE